MNDAKSMLMMYSYVARKAAEAKAAEEKAETKTKSNKQTKRRGKKNDEGTEVADSGVSEERVPVLAKRG